MRFYAYEEKQKSQVIRSGNLRFLLLQIKFFCRVLDIRVSEVMESNLLHAEGFYDFFERMVNRLVAQVSSYFCCEHLSKDSQEMDL